ncbi:MFS transporter [Nocardia wallacei]|uniref:MFS transporter n=1 Tax=Nocardia wallacei TaxID=480035 RepID=UPI00245754DD|nr:MFS transporter [Nocardia wallacei]
MTGSTSETTADPAREDSGAPPWLPLAIAMAAAGFSLRPPITALGAALGFVPETAEFDPAVLGWVVTVPLWCYALGGVLTPRAAAHWGTARTVTAALAVMTAGQLLRVTGGAAALLAGTTITALATAVLATLLPVLAARSGALMPRLTAIYAPAIGIGSAAGAFATAPISAASSWRWGLALWAPLCAVALALWLRARWQPNTPAPSPPARTDATQSTRTSDGHDRGSWTGGDAAQRTRTSDRHDHRSQTADDAAHGTRTSDRHDHRSRTADDAAQSTRTSDGHDRGSRAGGDAAQRTRTSEDRAGHDRGLRGGGVVSPRGRIWGSRLAWAMAVLFGGWAVGAFAVMSWLPSIYRDAGVDGTWAGVLLGLAAAAGIPVAVVLPGWVRRAWGGPGRDIPILAVTGLPAVGLLGLWWAPAVVPWLWAIGVGVGLGGLSLILTLIPLSAPGPRPATTLSAVTHGAGYAVAGGGVAALSTLRVHSDDWGPIIWILLAACVIQAVAGATVLRSGPSGSRCGVSGWR